MTGNTISNKITKVELETNYGNIILELYSDKAPITTENFLTYVKNPALASIGKFLTSVFNPNGFFYNFFYFILVVGFTFFYTMVVFNPEKISEEIQKHGGFIPGIRPGSNTAVYIANILTRLTLVGALFLGVIAVLPLLMMALTDIAAFAIGGTGLLIVASVVIDLIKKIDAQVSVREY